MADAFRRIELLAHTRGSLQIVTSGPNQPVFVKVAYCEGIMAKNLYEAVMILWPERDVEPATPPAR